MAEASRYWFSHREVVSSLIKAQGIHEGLWALSVEFGLVAVNAGPDDERLSPTAMIPVKRIGIIKIDEPNIMSVDAATVNPPPKKSAKSKAR